MLKITKEDVLGNALVIGIYEINRPYHILSTESTKSILLGTSGYDSEGAEGEGQGVIKTT